MKTARCDDLAADNKAPKLPHQAKAEDDRLPDSKTTTLLEIKVSLPEVEKHVLAVLRHFALDDGVVARTHNDERHKDLSHRNGWRCKDDRGALGTSGGGVSDYCDFIMRDLLL